MLRVIVVDDEPLARRGLRQLLAMHPQVTVVGEAADADAARELIAEERPDAVFLDIRMPGADGFSLVGAGGFSPKVVFVTAYSEHAARAFEVEAVDYLLKPVRPERLASAIHRLEEACKGNEASASYHATDRLCLRTPQRTLVVPLRSVAALVADGDFTRFLLRGEKALLICHSLGSYERVLPSPPFLRLDRSIIVNLELVVRTERRSRDEARLELDGLDEPLVIGRTAQARLREALGH